MKDRLIGVVASMLLTPVVMAHHGDEMVVLESYDIGHPGDGHLLGTFDFERYGGIDELSSEVSLFFSPLKRVGIGVDVRFAEEGDGDWVFSSVTPRLQVQLTDPDSDGRLRAGFSVGYQFSEDLRRTKTVTTVDETVRRVTVPAVAEPRKTRRVVIEEVKEEPPVGDGGGTVEEPCDPLFDLDCEQGKVSKKRRKGRSKHGAGHVVTATTEKRTVVESEVDGGGSKGETTKEVRERVERTEEVQERDHEGIHNHHANQWLGRLVVEAEIGKSTVVGNLIAVRPDGDDVLWGYGLGIKRPLAGAFSGALEVIGDLDAGGQHEVVGSVSCELGKGVMVRVAAGTGLTSESADVTLRGGVLWRF